MALENPREPLFLGKEPERSRPAEIELMRFINRKLYEKGRITEQLYRRANEEFLRG